MTREDPRLVRLTEICLALPEATRQDLGQRAIFKVRGKTFAYFLNDYKGDGIVAASGRVPWCEGANGGAIAAARYSMPCYVSRRDWIALRLDRGEIDWAEVTDLVSGSYRLVAAKPLVLQMDVAGWLRLSRSSGDET